MQRPVITWRCAPATADQLAAWRKLWARLLGNNSEVQEVSEPCRPQLFEGGTRNQRRSNDAAVTKEPSNDTRNIDLSSNSA
jgi:hypothetical protein